MIIIMNINALDIVIIFILVGFTLSGAYSKFILSLKSTASLIGSIFISKIILDNLILCVFLISVTFFLDFGYVFSELGYVFPRNTWKKPSNLTSFG